MRGHAYMARKFRKLEKDGGVMAGFYKVVLNGTYQGEDNQNSLYYRTAIDPLGGALGFGGAEQLAELVNTHIVPSFLACKPETYILQTIDVTPRNGLFELIYQLPYKMEINEQGSGGLLTNKTDGPALALNIRFNLEPTVIGLQTFSAPKRGYIAVGPVSSDWIDDSGRLTDEFLNNPTNDFNVLCEKLSMDLVSLLPPCDFFPVRVAQHYGSVAGSLLGWGYADVQGASLDEYVSFRRSRRITG
jgi:hypothetical protein